MNNTLNLTGKAAVFARGFMEYFDEQLEAGKSPVPLRDCQEAGAARVTELGDEISVAYISKIARELGKDKLFKKIKKGRSFFLEEGEDTEEFMIWITDGPERRAEWGSDLNADAMSELRDRETIIEVMKERKALRINTERQLPKAMYSFLMKKFNEGKLDLVFVYADKTAWWGDTDHPLEIHTEEISELYDYE